MQSLIKQLTVQMNNMEALPSTFYIHPKADQSTDNCIHRCLSERRFVAFKLLYHDDTPDNYQPPYFQEADSEKDQWFLSTHNPKEIPEKFDVASWDSGHHRFVA